jgi:AcrR family transcriptional regulator
VTRIIGVVTPPRPAAQQGLPVDGLRERKKRLMRQALSDKATAMFMERGFDAVRVAEIAEVCGVSETTVFNYFPTKEALVLDRLETTMASLRDSLSAPGAEPIEATIRVLDAELSAMTRWLADQNDPAQAAEGVTRFGELIRATPSLRAYHSDMSDQCVSMTAEILARRAGVEPEDPEPQVAARALIGLWHVQSHSLRRHLHTAATPAQVHASVTADVRRAADLVDAGLRSFLDYEKRPRRHAPAGPRS